jgi:Spy/CpxP family protein refolding chaperone
MLVLAAAAGVLFAGAAVAADDPPGTCTGTGPHGPRAGHHGRVGPPEERWERMTADLNLTDAQRADIREIVTKNRSDVRPLMEDLVNARMDLNAAVTAPSPDEGDIRSATERLVRAQTSLALERARIASEVRSVLTPDQQAMFDAKRARARDQVGKRMARRHAHGHGPWDDDSSDDDSDDSR